MIKYLIFITFALASNISCEGNDRMKKDDEARARCALNVACRSDDEQEHLNNNGQLKQVLDDREPTRECFSNLTKQNQELLLQKISEAANKHITSLSQLFEACHHDIDEKKLVDKFVEFLQEGRKETAKAGKEESRKFTKFINCIVATTRKCLELQRTFSKDATYKEAPPILSVYHYDED